MSSSVWFGQACRAVLIKVMAVKNIFPNISLTVWTVTRKNYPWDPWRTILIMLIHPFFSEKTGLLILVWSGARLLLVTIRQNEQYQWAKSPRNVLNTAFGSVLGNYVFFFQDSMPWNWRIPASKSYTPCGWPIFENDSEERIYCKYSIWISQGWLTPRNIELCA